MSSSAISTSSKPRLWVLPWGLYPRRVTIYLADKGLQDEFEIIPIDITPSGMEEAEGKPAGTLPILELSRPTASQPGRYIYQSSAILEYLEDVYGAQGQDMRGGTAEARARTRECMDAVNEATTWMLLYIQNGSTLYAAMREQALDSAREGHERMHKALALLEKLSDPEGPYLLGQTPTIVDCVLMASAQFAEHVYHFSLTDHHPRLKMVVEAFGKRGTAVFPPLPSPLAQMDIKMHV